MTSAQFLELVENKLREHNVCKVIPTTEVVEQHARKVIEAQKAEEVVKKLRPRIAKQAAAVALPDRLIDQVAELLEVEPRLAWDDAVARVVRG